MNGSQDPYLRLRDAIIKQTVSDWRRIKRRRKTEGESLKKIREFFHSDFALVLCGEVDPLYILERLEKETTKKQKHKEEKY